MPIRPENRWLYPIDWEQLSAVLFARPTDEIVGGDHQMAEAMAQVIVEARKDSDTIGQTDDT